MSLDRGCLSRGTIKHEALHNLGFEHTHSRSDRDKYVKIMYENIQIGQKYAFEILDTHNELVKYDFQSVMHYQPYAFSSNGKRTIEPKVSGVRDFGGDDVNMLDIEMVKRLYQCN